MVLLWVGVGRLLARGVAGSTPSLTCFTQTRVLKRVNTQSQAHSQNLESVPSQALGSAVITWWWMEGRRNEKEKKSWFSPINSPITSLLCLRPSASSPSVCCTPLRAEIEGRWNRMEGGREVAAVLRSHLIKEHFSRRRLGARPCVLARTSWRSLKKRCSVLAEHLSTAANKWKQLSGNLRGKPC